MISLLQPERVSLEARTARQVHVLDVWRNLVAQYVELAEWEEFTHLGAKDSFRL